MYVKIIASQNQRWDIFWDTVWYDYYYYKYKDYTDTVTKKMLQVQYTK